MKNGVYFIVMAFLVAKLFKILIYANRMNCDITMWAQSDVKVQNMEYLCKYQVYTVEILQG